MSPQSRRFFGGEFRNMSAILSQFHRSVVAVVRVDAFEFDNREFRVKCDVNRVN